LTEITDWELSFEISHPIDPQNECFVKFTFPETIDISELDLENIEGSGMFSDASGAK
jgi:hypothetical protein